MAIGLGEKLLNIVKVDILKKLGENENTFVGRCFYLDYYTGKVLMADAWKQKAGGIPSGTLLLATFVNPQIEGYEEAFLLRVIKQTSLPTDNDNISAMVEYYKDSMEENGDERKIDDFTRYEFSFSGVECSVLGTFYRGEKEEILFGADVENFYSAVNYKVYKADGKILEFICNLRDKDTIVGGETDVKIGIARYSSTRKMQQELDGEESNISVIYVNSQDFLGKRTALFGMTRTGKSNTVKIIIQAIQHLSESAKYHCLNDCQEQEQEANTESFDSCGKPLVRVGQIIFDLNGEYANANKQDKGTAIFDLYENTERYSIKEKAGFKVMKTNFYNEPIAALGMIKNYFDDMGESARYITDFINIDLEKPQDLTDINVKTRYYRKLAAYKCCLYRAGLQSPEDKIYFKGKIDLNSKILDEKTKPIDPELGISYDNAIKWFNWVWENYETDSYLSSYKKDNSQEWADEDLKSILAFLSGFGKPGGKSKISGYRTLKPMKNYHSEVNKSAFTKDIIEYLRAGKIVIIDLSQGDELVKSLYSEKICKEIFRDAMSNFIDNKVNNFIQLYFEEAHNLFPRKENSDLSQIYNKIAKEGAKLNLGLIYATQEVSSISSNILKNTQNWFIAHLNNSEEIRELEKYYDFKDFSEGLTKFSAASDKGFIKMKTYSSPFTVSVQIDKFGKV